MTKEQELMLAEVERRLKAKATTEAKRQVMERIMADMRYCVEHMDELEYGIDFCHNMAVAVGAREGDYRGIQDLIVRNTQRCLIGRMMSLCSSRRVKDPDCTNPMETLLPGSQWVYRGMCAFVRRCSHDFTVHFKCGKRGGVPRFAEQAEKIGKLIKDAEAA